MKFFTICNFSKRIISINKLANIFTFIILFSSTILTNELHNNEKKLKAFAAPTGLNSVDEIEVDGLIKKFVKVDGFRDGIQKGIFDETGSDNKKLINFEQEELQRGGEFNTYDDNSLIDSNKENPLFIPDPYRKKTTEEEKFEKKLPLIKRPVISPSLNNNKLPILVQTTPVPETAALSQLKSQFISQQFVQPQTLTRPPIIQPQPLQNFGQQLLQNSQVKPVVASQFRSNIVLHKTPFSSPSSLQSPVHHQISLHQFQHQILQQPISHLQSQNIQLQQEFKSQTLSQKFDRLRKPLPQPQLLQTLPPRVAHPFQSRNNVVNFSSPPQSLFGHQNSNLRTGVCAYTIFYNVAPASTFDIQFTYSHFASVVSVDQCARTCFEFNCAFALFDPVNRHCQFNPSTSLSISKDTCLKWPNLIYRNNFVVTGQTPQKISCITCQKKQKSNRRPFVLKTTDQNHFNPHSFSHSTIANAAVHGVILEQPRSIVIDRRYNGQNIETFKKAKFLPNKDFQFGLAVATRTTIKPLVKFNNNNFDDLFASQSIQTPLKSKSVDKRFKKSTNINQVKNTSNIISTKPIFVHDSTLKNYKV